MGYRAIFVILCLAAAGVAQVQERLTNAAQGYSFTPPKGFLAQASGEGFALVNQAKTIVIAVKGHSYRDFAAFLADANLERDGLEPVGKPQQITGGTTFRTVKRTPQGMAVIDTSVLFSPYGGGVVIAAISDEVNANAGFEAGIALAGTVKFAVVKQSAATDKVRSALAGKMLTYLYTGNGYSERMDIVLCRSGAAYRSTDMGGFTPENSDGASFSALSRKAGTWKIGPDGGTLIITMNVGGVFEYRLAARLASNEISLNNKRFFVQDQEICK